MTKVFCAEITCKHNVGNICRLKEINLSAANINTVHEGRKDVWYCRAFELSEAAKELKQILFEYGIGKE